MSDSEMYEAQGRAHAALKRSKAKVATLTAELMLFGDRLTELGKMCHNFVDLPQGKLPIGIPSSERRFQEEFGDIAPARVQQLIAELADELERVRVLSEQIEQF